MELKTCKACNKPKAHSSFYKNGRGGILARCKHCISEGRYIALRAKEPLNFTSHIRLSNVVKKNYIETYELLEKMGYDLKQDIHIQFCKKHNLEPNNPKKEFINHISVEECLIFD